MPSEITRSLSSITDIVRLVDTIAAHLDMKIEEKQVILEQADVAARVDLILGKIDAELDLIQVEKGSGDESKKQMERSQREYHLNEQMKAIQRRWVLWARVLVSSRN